MRRLLVIVLLMLSGLATSTQSVGADTSVIHAQHVLDDGQGDSPTMP